MSLTIHHSTENADFIAEIVAGWTGVQLVNLGVVASMTISDYNMHLTNASFYRSLTAAYVLIFQTDTLIRKPISAEYLNQSTGYDYVGAPWPPYFAPSPNIRVGNGGFSLRRVAAMIDFVSAATAQKGSCRKTSGSRCSWTDQCRSTQSSRRCASQLKQSNMTIRSASIKCGCSRTTGIACSI